MSFVVVPVTGDPFRCCRGRRVLTAVLAQQFSHLPVAASTAMRTGVVPSLALTFTSAPLASSTATSLSPFCAAQCNGVQPPERLAFASAPLARSSLATSAAFSAAL